MDKVPSIAEPHILVVEDDTGTRALLARFLGENGFRATGARNGAIALQPATSAGIAPTASARDRTLYLQPFGVLVVFKGWRWRRGGVDGRVSILIALGGQWGARAL